jgi:subtilisin
MVTKSTTRRGLLRGVSGGTVGALMAGQATGRPPKRIVGTSSPDATREARRRAESVGRTLDFGSIGRAVAGRFSDQAIEALRRREDVRYVERDGTMRAIHYDPGHDGGPPGDGGGGGGDTVETLPWGIDRVNAEVAHANDETGSGADVAIIDTGIDSDHPDLEANLDSGKAFVSWTELQCRLGR